MADGNNISNLYNYNEYLSRKYAIKYMQDSPDVVCLGSSRIMQINNTIFDNQTFFNMGVSAISLKEIIASYNVLKGKDFEPKTIIIGIDPSIFLKNKSKLRDYFVEDFISYTKDENLDNSVDIVYSKGKFIELISPFYFFENIKYGKKNYVITKDIFIDEPVVCYDGSYVYNSRKRNQSENEVLLEAKDQYNRFFYDRFNNMSMDNDLISLFESFISKLESKHKIVFFLAPYHPFIAEKFNLSELKIILNVEDYFKNFAVRKKIDLFGSFDPKEVELKLNPSDFYDGVHIKREVVEKIFKYHLDKNEIIIGN
jgi:hypothetical protein